ncbi:NAD(P)/FAD-dependent oxidoreductase, partial [Mangrovicoccus ximenensis]|uniref:NAD(P)/FAD-dependent oxidoreductase n=1 Tax=Mangrovicoccus ximenensis TaxID=1911570 RepID=UPI001F336725
TAPKLWDLAVIGAGPAGMAAAATAAKAGLSVVLLDEGEAPGGQIYRDIETATPARRKVLGPDYAAGGPLAEAVRSGALTYLPRSMVWNISTDRVLDISRDGGSTQLRAQYVLAATGAVERPCPVPGWTKPGVTTVGALQILLKSAGIVEEDAILAGSGPLLWLVAKQMIDAGIRPVAVVDTTPKGRMQAALPHLAGALRGHRYLRKGLGLMLAALRQCRRRPFDHARGAGHAARPRRGAAPPGRLNPNTKRAVRAPTTPTRRPT